MSKKRMTKSDWRRLEETLAADPSVIAGWLFGSAQEGRIRPGGDIDVAILFDEKPDWDRLADLRAALQDALDFDNVDMVILHDASPITRFEAVSGKLIFCRSRSQMAEFVSLTAREYEDEMAMLRKALRYPRPSRQ